MPMRALAKWLRENAGRVAWTQPKPDPKKPKTAVEAKAFLQKHVQTQKVVFEKLAELLDAFGEKQVEEKLDVKELASLPDIQNLDFKNAFTGTRTQATDEVRKQVEDDVRKQVVADIAQRLGVGEQNSVFALVQAVREKMAEEPNTRLREFMTELGVPEGKEITTYTNLHIPSLVERVTTAIREQTTTSGALHQALNSRDFNRDQELMQEIDAYRNWFSKIAEQKLVYQTNTVTGDSEPAQAVLAPEPQASRLDTTWLLTLSLWTRAVVSYATSELAGSIDSLSGHSEEIAQMMNSVDNRIRDKITENTNPLKKELNAIQTEVSEWKRYMRMAVAKFGEKMERKSPMPSIEYDLYLYEEPRYLEHLVAIAESYRNMCLEIVRVLGTRTQFVWKKTQEFPTRYEWQTSTIPPYFLLKYEETRGYLWDHVLESYKFKAIRDQMQEWTKDLPDVKKDDKTIFSEPLTMSSQDRNLELNVRSKSIVNSRTWTQALSFLTPLQKSSFRDAALAFVEQRLDPASSPVWSAAVASWGQMWSVALLYQQAARLFAMEYEIARDLQAWKEERRIEGKSLDLSATTEKLKNPEKGAVVTCRRLFTDLAERLRAWFKMQQSQSDRWQSSMPQSAGSAWSTFVTEQNAAIVTVSTLTLPNSIKTDVTNTFREFRIFSFGDDVTRWFYYAIFAPSPADLTSYAGLREANPRDETRLEFLRTLHQLQDELDDQDTKQQIANGGTLSKGGWQAAWASRAARLTAHR
jgi:hypothetical protein